LTAVETICDCPTGSNREAPASSPSPDVFYFPFLQGDCVIYLSHPHSARNTPRLGADKTMGIPWEWWGPGAVPIRESVHHTELNRTHTVGMYLYGPSLRILSESTISSLSSNSLSYHKRRQRRDRRTMWSLSQCFLFEVLSQWLGALGVSRLCCPHKGKGERTVGTHKEKDILVSQRQSFLPSPMLHFLLSPIM
jgi:hypothetical protein